jgi:uncharacterized protein YaaQ
MSMKLVMAIVQDQDAGRTVDALVSRGFGATRINTAGGFLKRGNATILVGVEQEDVDRVIETVEQTCVSRPVPDDAVTIGAGVLFVLGASGFVRL